jgi:signal transduction histidine kinase
MTNGRIPLLLFFTILVMTALPMTAAFSFLDDALQTSLNLGFNSQVVRALEIGSHNLKTLKDLDPDNREGYRQQFNEIENLRHIYSNPGMVKRSILDSLKIYFGLGLVAAAGLSVLVAVILSRRIARTYNVTFDELTKHREKVRYLEEMASWQELAKVLAHEIKNPLTPIEVLITSLTRSYVSKSADEFREQLSRTEAMINEEIAHLKSTVNKFSEFAKIPQVQLVEKNLFDVLQLHVSAMEATFESARFELEVADSPSLLQVRIDTTLFRQVMLNIARNAVEASPGRVVRFRVRVAAMNGHIQLSLSNDGEPVPAEIAPRIFDPYISGKKGRDNMGLGLAIVKMIVIEHGGEIMYLEEHGEPTFRISLPRVDRDA